MPLAVMVLDAAEYLEGGQLDMSAGFVDSLVGGVACSILVGCWVATRGNSETSCGIQKAS